MIAAFHALLTMPGWAVEPEVLVLACIFTVLCVWPAARNMRGV